MQVEQKCMSPYCPNNNTVMLHYQTTFSVPSSSSSNLKDIDTIFPLPGDIIGYCGSEFNKKPPKEVLHAINDCIDVTPGLGKESREIF